MKTIKVIQRGDRWFAYFSDDVQVLPTPYSVRSRTKTEVESLLLKRNPGFVIEY